MLKTGMILPSALSLTWGVCTVCWQQQRWDEAVDATLAAEFPEAHVHARGMGVPANHPYWVRQQALYEAYAVPILEFAYDDCWVGLCAQHGHEALAALSTVTRPC